MSAGRLRGLLLVAFAWLVAAAATSSHAMTLVTQGNVVFATGRVDDDLRAFEAALEQPGVDTVVFVNSPGGDLWTGLRVGRLIASKQLDTVVAGSCSSACSLMFMGGKRRRFSDAFHPGVTFVGIHGAHIAETKSVHPIVQPEVFAFYKQHMGERFDAAVMNQALYDMADAGALLRVYESSRNPKARPVHCRAQQTPSASCTTFAAHDAASLGVITHADLVKLELPEAFRSALRLFGVDMAPLQVADIDAHLAALARRVCNDDACRTRTVPLLEAWQQASRHKAIAVGRNGRWGQARNAPDPGQAVLRAVFFCNHGRGGVVQLCDADLVDDFDVRGIDTQARRSHTEALARLEPPAEGFHANEEYGGSFTTASGLRTEKPIDMTPGSIEGVRTVGTGEVVRLLRAQAPPVLIDVEGMVATVPGSAALAFGGVALADPVKDKALEARITALLKLLAPDDSQPIVFFGSSRESWYPVNAAMRARSAGYAKVMWYRGGTASWNAAGLPTARLVLRAVAN